MFIFVSRQKIGEMGGKRLREYVGWIPGVLRFQTDVRVLVQYLVFSNFIQTCKLLIEKHHMTDNSFQWQDNGQEVYWMLYIKIILNLLFGMCLIWIYRYMFHPYFCPWRLGFSFCFKENVFKNEYAITGGKFVQEEI